MENLKIYEELKTVPEVAKKKITGGRLSGMTDINPMWRIKKLTETFGICGFGWKYEVTEKRLEKGANDEISAFVQINLFIKIDQVWSDAIPGLGGASFVAKEKNGLYVSDECFKMALTDAISIACKALGMGADVYFEKDRTKYDQRQPEINPEFDRMLTNSMASIDEIQSIEELTDLWNNSKALHGNKIFIDAIKAKKTKLQ